VCACHPVSLSADMSCLPTYLCVCGLHGVLHFDYAFV
jgi:hypothetical protein